MSYRLVDHGYPFKKIMHGKAWVGRVGRHADGRYLGTIGKLTVPADTELDAFREVVAKHLGYDSASALLEKNAQVRRTRRRQRKHAQWVASELVRGNFRPFDALFRRGL